VKSTACLVSLPGTVIAFDRATFQTPSRGDTMTCNDFDFEPYDEAVRLEAALEELSSPVWEGLENWLSDWNEEFQ
jgi:hypothetical protein